MNHSRDCIFCKIISGEIHTDILFQDEENICFLPLVQDVYGHCLIVPKQHIENINDTTKAQFSSLTEFVKTVSNFFTEKLDTDNFNLLIANGPNAQQSVPHIHFHYFPRFEKDIVDAWPSLIPVTEEKRKEFLLNVNAE